MGTTWFKDVSRARRGGTLYLSVPFTWLMPRARAAAARGRAQTVYAFYRLDGIARNFFLYCSGIVTRFAVWIEKRVTHFATEKPENLPKTRKQLRVFGTSQTLNSCPHPTVRRRIAIWAEVFTRFLPIVIYILSYLLYCLEEKVRNTPPIYLGEQKTRKQSGHGAAIGCQVGRR